MLFEINKEVPLTKSFLALKCTANTNYDIVCLYLPCIKMYHNEYYSITLSYYKYLLAFRFLYLIKYGAAKNNTSKNTYKLISYYHRHWIVYILQYKLLDIKKQQTHLS